MSRYNHRRDSNEPEIIRTLTDASARVRRIESPDDDEPDLLVGFLGRLYLLEIKAPKTGRLSEGQKAAHKKWAKVGVTVHVVRSVREACEAVGIGPQADEARRKALGEIASALTRKSADFERRSGRLSPSKRDYRPTSAWEQAHEPSRVPESADG